MGKLGHVEQLHSSRLARFIRMVGCVFPRASRSRPIIGAFNLCARRGGTIFMRDIISRIIMTITSHKDLAPQRTPRAAAASTDDVQAPHFTPSSESIFAMSVVGRLQAKSRHT
jgi:hypothetical protein